jgi:hypothetical protein
MLFSWLSVIRVCSRARAMMLSSFPGGLMLRGVIHDFSHYLVPPGPEDLDAATSRGFLNDLPLARNEINLLRNGSGRLAFEANSPQT